MAGWRIVALMPSARLVGLALLRFRAPRRRFDGNRTLLSLALNNLGGPGSARLPFASAVRGADADQSEWIDQSIDRSISFFFCNAAANRSSVSMRQSADTPELWNASRRAVSSNGCAGERQSRNKCSNTIIAG